MSYESHKYYNGNLCANITKDVKIQQLFMDLHVGIVMDVKQTDNYYETYIQVLQWLLKKPIIITRLICEYCICEMVLWIL
jgi:hypothetical protein